MTAVRPRRVTYDPRGPSSPVVVEIPHVQLATLNSGRGKSRHWRVAAERAKTNRTSARWHTLSAVTPARRRLFLLDGMTVTITRVASGTLDDDNLAGSAKAIRDGIADAFGIDDRDERVTWRYAQERAPRHVWGARVAFERRPQETPERVLYRDDPVRFATEVLGFELSKRQQEILRALRHEPSAALRHVRALGDASKGKR